MPNLTFNTHDITHDITLPVTSNFILDAASTTELFGRGTTPTPTTTAAAAAPFPLAPRRGCRTLGRRIQLGLDPLNGVADAFHVVRVGPGESRDVGISDAEQVLHCVDPPGQDSRDVHGEADGDEELGQGRDLKVARLSALLG